MGPDLERGPLVCDLWVTLTFLTLACLDGLFSKFTGRSLPDQSLFVHKTLVEVNIRADAPGPGEQRAVDTT